jgi:hypothetical protein
VTSLLDIEPYRKDQFYIETDHDMSPNQQNRADETTPLIPAAEDDNNSIAPNKNDTNIDKPLPVGQIMLLSFARMVEPIAFFSIFPFINHMIEECGDVAETDVGFYSGLIV